MNPLALQVTFLLPDQAVQQLKAGRAIEQWLGHRTTADYRLIRWLSVAPSRGGTYDLMVFEVFDSGGPEMLDIYSFEPIDPDFPNGIISVFQDPEAAISAAVEHGGSVEHFVGFGVIQDMYAAFLSQHGLAPRS